MNKAAITVVLFWVCTCSACTPARSLSPIASATFTLTSTLTVTATPQPSPSSTPSAAPTLPPASPTATDVPTTTPSPTALPPTPTASATASPTMAPPTVTPSPSVTVTPIPSTAPPAATLAATTELYADGALGIRTQYPAAWLVEVGAGQVFFIPPDRAGLISISGLDFGIALEPESVLERYIEHFAGEHSGIERGDTIDMEVAGERAVLTAVKYEDGAVMNLVVVGVVHDEWGYVLALLAQEADAAFMRAVFFDCVLANWEFVK